MSRPPPKIDTTQPPKGSTPALKWMFGIAGIAIYGIIAMTLMLSCNNNGKNDTESHNRIGKETKNKELTGTIGDHEWVDLGLPSGLKWATCNVGASAPEEYGDYYAWGETEPKTDYTTISSLTYKISFRKLKNSGIVDESGNLTKEYDVASTTWGDSWRMPTDDEFQELISSCKWNFAAMNGINGYLVTGPNNKNIFLPAAAFRQNSTVENLGEFGDYWSSTVVKELSGVSCSLGYSSKTYGRRRYARYAGRTIRPVTD